MNTQDNASITSLNSTALSDELASNAIQQIKMLEDGDTNVRIMLAKDSSLLPATQTKLLQDPEENVLVSLARNLSLIDEVQEQLASTGTPAVREALAANPSLNEELQNYLASTGSDEVKCQLAKNPSLILSIQSPFSVDATYGIRASLAENPSLDKVCQAKLMQDGDEYAQHHVYTLMPLAGNPALSTEYHARLAENEDSRIVASLAKNPSISIAIMERIAASDIEEVRACLACNPSLPESLQARLIAGSSNNVRIIIAQNGALKVAQQAQLAHNGHIDIRLALLENPSLDEKIRSRVVGSITSQDLSRAESALEYAEKEATNLFNEHQAALKKYINSHGRIFPSSEEKMELLQKAADRIQIRVIETDRKIIGIERKCRKIKVLLERQPANEQPATSSC